MPKLRASLWNWPSGCGTCSLVPGNHIAWSYWGAKPWLETVGFPRFLMLGGAWCRSKFQYFAGVLAHLLRVGFVEPKLAMCFVSVIGPTPMIIREYDDRMPAKGFETAERRKSWSNRWFGGGGVSSIPKSVKSGFVLSFFVILGRFLPWCSLTTTKINHLISLPEHVLSFFFFE